MNSCQCSHDEMAPALNQDGEAYTCETCGGHITREANDTYNQTNGYAGYDEYPEDTRGDDGQR